MSDILEIKGLCKNFGGVKAIDSFNVKLEQGKVHGLIGPNGAGKTTLLNSLPGKPHGVVKAGFAHAPEGRQILANLTVLDNLLVGAYLRSDRAGIKRDLGVCILTVSAA